VLFGQKVNRTLAQPGAYPNTATEGSVLQAALEACDALDGVADGLVSNQLTCNATFDPGHRVRERRAAALCRAAPTPATPACPTRRSPR
jgi:hypothetical protein